MLKIKRNWVKNTLKFVANAGVGYVVKETINTFVPQDTPKQKALALVGRFAISAVIVAPIEERIDKFVDNTADALVLAKLDAEEIEACMKAKTEEI